MDHSGKRHETSMYDFRGKLPPTEPMPVVEEKILTPALTVRNVISSILERSMEAWKALPSSVKDAMLDFPHRFEFHEFGANGMAGGAKDLVPDIIYNKVRLRWDEVVKRWALYSIEV